MSESEMKQSANTVNRLDCRVVDKIGGIISKKSSKVVLELYKRIHTDLEAVAVDEIASAIDCQVSMDFINIASIRSARLFINAQCGKLVTA